MRPPLRIGQSGAAQGAGDFGSWRGLCGRHEKKHGSRKDPKSLRKTTEEGLGTLFAAMGGHRLNEARAAVGNATSAKDRPIGGDPGCGGFRFLAGALRPA